MSTWHFVRVQFDKYPNIVEVHTESANDQSRADHHPGNRPPTMKSNLEILVGFKVYSDNSWIVKRYEQSYKVGCGFPMVVVSILPDPVSGPGYHREDATHFILIFGVSLVFGQNRVLDQAIFSGSGFWRKWKSSNYSINRWFTFWKSSRNKK